MDTVKEIKPALKKHSDKPLAYLCQVIVLLVVILACILNLSLKNGNTDLWIALLSLSLGCFIPQPKLKSTTTAL